MMLVLARACGPGSYAGGLRACKGFGWPMPWLRVRRSLHAAPRQAGDPLAILIKAFSTVSQRRGKLFGLDAPTKVQSEVQVTELQSIIREIRAEKGGKEGAESAA